MDLSYKEKHDRLAIRIRAHKEFANFDISDWIADYLRRATRRAIFDLGCGDGNHLGLYLDAVGPSGRVVGMDREERLLAVAAEKYGESSNLELVRGSMDDRLPFPDATFDLCLSNFAIYNAGDVSATLRELHRVMTIGAQLVLVGPTADNARELYDFNERLTGERTDPITFIRTDRLRQEVLPHVRQVFGPVDTEIVNSKLTFPDQREFIQYYCSTMLYEEKAEKEGYTTEQMEAACGTTNDIVVSKEMLVVVAVKEA
jgi:ubiquinone/menaquinone biosynthesis C-methylase UbiE